MRDDGEIVNTLAPITNVALMLQLVDGLMNRAPGLPGIGVFSGPSGWGKSSAAAVAANRHRAFVVEVRSTYTTKHLFGMLAREMGLGDKGTTAQLGDRIAEELALSGRPLILDEADHLADKRMIEDVRGLYEASQGVLVLIGEERLPVRLERWERVASRVLDWVQAEPVSREDARHLARLYCRGVEIEEGLFDLLMKAAGQSARRVSTNLHLVGEQARRQGVTRIGLAGWGDRTFPNGRAPKARRID